MKKIIFLMLFATLGWQHAQAQRFTAGGLEYNIISPTTVEVGGQYRDGNDEQVGGNGGATGSVIIPEQVMDNSVTYSVISLGVNAFLGASALTSVTIPNSVTSIGGLAFAGCTGLTSVIIPDSVTSMGYYAFAGCSGLTSVIIPNSVTSIGDNAFEDCVGLTSVTIPNSVTSIGRAAFAYCNGLTSVIIPNSVTTIGDYAFYACSGLTSVICNIAIPLSLQASEAFGGFNQGACALTVPAGSVAAYQTAAVWQNFMVSASPTIPTTKVRASQCGVTLAALNTDIMADKVVAVTDYRFKVIANGVTEVIERGSKRFFNLIALTNGAVYNTAYTVSVAVKKNGVWGAYGNECVVTTPATVPVTKVKTVQCGATLAALNTDIMADWLQFATDYRFKVVNGANEQVIERGGSRFFNLTALTSGAAYNTAYTISVAVKHNGVWGDYGTECTVTTPAAPTTKIQTSQCGATLAALNTDVLANWLQFATEYRFKVVANGAEQVINRGNSRILKLTALTGGATAGTTYTISVAVKHNGVWGDYGTECTVRTSGSASNSRQIVENIAFSLVAYPNPSNSAFKLQINGVNDEAVSILVFDMTGRQIENKVVKASDIENISFGQNYSTGVYNVIVAQGMNTKTVRLVKR